MSIEDGTTEYRIKKPVQYSHKGKQETATFVLLKEPGMDHIKYYLRLKQMMVQSQMELASKAEEINKMRSSVGEEVNPFHEEARDIEQQTIEMVPAVALGLQASKAVNIGDFIDIFRDMICHRGRKAICQLNGEEQMTTAIWDNLRPNDAFDMAVWWCCFFAMPSDVQDKTTLDQQSESRMVRTVA